MLGGSQSYNRSQWLIEALRFGPNGQSRFGDSRNRFDIQQKRLCSLHSWKQADILDGASRNRVYCFDVLDARATFRNGSAPGTDDLPPEVFKELPYAAVVIIMSYFQNRYDSIAADGPTSWREL